MTITDNLINEINNKLNKLLEEKEQIIVSIDGPAGSGKTTLASKLNGFVFHMDDFYNPDKSQKENISIGSNIDIKRFKQEVLEQLKNNIKEFKYSIYSCKNNTFTKQDYIYNNIIIIEGVYSNLDCFKDYIDYRIYCDIDKSTQLERLKQRPNFIDFINIWLPKEEKYFNELDIKSSANLIIK